MAPQGPPRNTLQELLAPAGEGDCWHGLLWGRCTQGTKRAQQWPGGPAVWLSMAWTSLVWPVWTRKRHQCRPMLVSGSPRQGLHLRHDFNASHHVTMGLKIKAWTQALASEKRESLAWHAPEPAYYPNVSKWINLPVSTYCSCANKLILVRPCVTNYNFFAGDSSSRACRECSGFTIHSCGASMSAAKETWMATSLCNGYLYQQETWLETFSIMYEHWC